MNEVHEILKKVASNTAIIDFLKKLRDEEQVVHDWYGTPTFCSAFVERRKRLESLGEMTEKSLELDICRYTSSSLITSRFFIGRLTIEILLLEAENIKLQEKLCELKKGAAETMHQTLKCNIDAICAEPIEKRRTLFELCNAFRNPSMNLI